jgi:hypothetical protein
LAQVDTQVISKNDKTRGKRRYKLDWKLRSFERLPLSGRQGAWGGLAKSFRWACPLEGIVRSGALSRANDRRYPEFQEHKLIYATYPHNRSRRTRCLCQ